MKKIIFLAGFLAIVSFAVPNKTSAVRGGCSPPYFYNSVWHNYYYPGYYHSTFYYPSYPVFRTYRYPKFYRHHFRHNHRPYFYRYRHY